MPFVPSESGKVNFAEMDKIIDLLLFKLAKKGMFGVLEFWNECKNYDMNNEELIDSKSFNKVVIDLRLDLKMNEISQVLRTYEGKNNFEFMNYHLLVKDLCINLNNFRKD